jgi:hypothetical protein
MQSISSLDFVSDHCEKPALIANFDCPIRMNRESWLYKSFSPRCCWMIILEICLCYFILFQNKEFCSYLDILPLDCFLFPHNGFTMHAFMSLYFIPGNCLMLSCVTDRKCVIMSSTNKHFCLIASSIVVSSNRTNNLYVLRLRQRGCGS